MAKCDTCKHKTTEDGWLVCDCCVHEPSMGDRYEPFTNADRIRAMTDEELAKFLNWYARDPWTSPSGGWNEWLQQPCEEGTV